MAFRGQYIFVTDDEADSDDSNKSPVKTAKPSKLTAAKSKLATANSSKLTTAKSTKTTAASRLSRRSAASSTKSTISRSTKVLSRQASDDEYYEDYRYDFFYLETAGMVHSLALVILIWLFTLLMFFYCAFDVSFLTSLYLFAYT